MLLLLSSLTVVGDEHDKVPATTPLPPLTASNDAAARRESQSPSSRTNGLGTGAGISGVEGGRILGRKAAGAWGGRRPEAGEGGGQGAARKAAGARGGRLPEAGEEGGRSTGRMAAGARCWEEVVTRRGS